MSAKKRAIRTCILAITAYRDYDCKRGANPIVAPLLHLAPLTNRPIQSFFSHPFPLPRDKFRQFNFHPFPSPEKRPRKLSSGLILVFESVESKFATSRPVHRQPQTVTIYALPTALHLHDALPPTTETLKTGSRHHHSYYPGQPLSARKKSFLNHHSTKNTIDLSSRQK